MADLGADVGDRLRRRGMRMTDQRRRVINALAGHAHRTPEELTAAVAEDGGAPLPPSTVYRTLEALEQIGVVRHTHLDHGAPTYHLEDHDGHLHLVCRRCGAVLEVPASHAGSFVEQISAQTGFMADPTHMAIHGRCATCHEELSS
ncbi:Fur family transcriptional regulator [Janibacter sp. GXQ6167]|uniref:Fur family transcriptional regulator n=1 Tax=Janibacter sp. GXQ6167 TaxID=3240791 RepID=UPI003523DE6D